VVYKGTWLGKEVVIRVFRNVQSVEGQCSELLTKMARIRHPNIALFMAAAVSENKLAIVTEYVSNGNVGGLNLTSQNLLHLAKGIAVGCAYLRKQGFAHKNLKPSNVLIDSGIDVKLTDYFVKEFNELFHPSFNCQSEPVAYLGPEALRQTPFVPFGIDSASDVFAFGMICWEMLTARQPYLGLSRAQIRVLVGYAGYRESRLSCGTLRGLARLIEKCTAQEPPMRPTFERVILAISALHSSANSAAEDALITFISGR
jgi:serine/threonine protein kinase